MHARHALPAALRAGHSLSTVMASDWDGAVTCVSFAWHVMLAGAPSLYFSARILLVQRVRRRLHRDWLPMHTQLALLCIDSGC